MSKLNSKGATLGWVARCSGCSRASTVPTMRKEDAERMFELAGWTADDEERQTCPACQATE